MGILPSAFQQYRGVVSEIILPSLPEAWECRIFPASHFPWRSQGSGRASIPHLVQRLEVIVVSSAFAVRTVCDHCIVPLRRRKVGGSAATVGGGHLRGCLRRVGMSRPLLSRLGSLCT